MKKLVFSIAYQKKKAAAGLFFMVCRGCQVRPCLVQLEGPGCLVCTEHRWCVQNTLQSCWWQKASQQFSHLHVH